MKQKLFFLLAASVCMFGVAIGDASAQAPLFNISSHESALSASQCQGEAARTLEATGFTNIVYFGSHSNIVAGTQGNVSAAFFCMSEKQVVIVTVAGQNIAIVQDYATRLNGRFNPNGSPMKGGGEPARRPVSRSSNR